MKCPFCGNEMAEGKLSGDGRCKVRWDAKDEKPSLMDKALGIGTVDAKYKLFKFEIDAMYCYDCKKMIIDTSLAK